MATLKVEGRLDSAGFNTGANQMKSQLKSIKNTANANGGVLGDFGKALNTSKGSLTGFASSLIGSNAALLKLGVAGFAATGVIDGFKKVINGSQTTCDAFNNMMLTSNTVIDNFCTALARADFSVFEQGLDMMIKKGWDAAAALDQYWNTMQAYGMVESQYGNLFQDDITNVRDKALTKEQRTAALAHAKLVMNKISESAGVAYDDAFKVVRTAIAAKSKLTEEQITDEMIRQAVQLDATAGRDKAKAKYAKQMQKYTGYWTTNKAGQSYYKPSTEQQIRPEDRQAAVTTTLLEIYSDDELQKNNETIKAADAIMRQDIANRRIYNRAKQQLNDKETKTGNDKTKANEKTYIEGSFAWYENTIKKLQEQLKDINIEINPDEYRAVKKQIDELTLEKTILFELDVDEIQLMKLQAKAKELQDVLKAQISVGMNQSDIASTIRQINNITNQIDDIKLGVEIYTDPVKKAKTELDRAKKDLNFLIVTHADTSEIEAKLDYIKTLEKQLERFDITVDYNLNKDNFKKEFDDLFKEDKTQSAINKYRKQFDSVGAAKQVEKPVTEQDFNLNMSINASIFDELISKIEKLTEVKKKLDEQFKTAVAAGDYQMMEQLAIAYEETDKNIQKTTESINALTEQQQKLNNQKDESNKKDKQTKKTQMMLSGLSSSLQSAGAAFGAFAEESQAATTAQKAFTIAAAVAQLVAQFAAIPKGAEIWSWIAGTVSGVATLVTAIAQIKSASKFASGGIVGGSSFSGDYNIARVNSGEMILNGTQQARLFRMLNSDSIGSGSLPNEIRLVAKGSDLVGIIKNYDTKRSKI